MDERAVGPLFEDTEGESQEEQEQKGSDYEAGQSTPAEPSRSPCHEAGDHGAQTESRHHEPDPPVLVIFTCEEPTKDKGCERSYPQPKSKVCP